MSKIKYLFCEGDEDSFDRKLLQSMLDKLDEENLASPTIVPSGGKGNMPNFMLGYLGKNKARNLTEANALGFRDRDFDAPVPQGKPSLTESKNPNILLSYRAAVENYLLDPATFWQYIQAEKLETALSLQSELDVLSFFEKTARGLRYYSAARWALGNLRERVELKTTWTKDGSGDLPKSLLEQDCIDGAISLIIKAKEGFEKYSERRFRNLYSSYLEKFDDEFFVSRDYLVWFHGKDLKEAIRTSPVISKSKFSIENYFRFAMQNFDFRQFGDLVELYERLK